ncbi:MAG: sigma-54 interaction domain-containing protein [Acidobacteriota bacterium]
MAGGALPTSRRQLDLPFVAQDPRIREIVALLRRLANAPANVLISGESGTGKDLAAHALHLWGSRAEKPFVKIDLPSVPAELLESELFGYERGAFTGARESKPGKLEMAPGGTVFLDQIGELEPALQAKLLRVVEDRRFERVGGTRTQTVDARIVASTSADLKEAVARNSFRQDLFYRLSVFWIQLPPLRERKGDILPLAKFFLERKAEKLSWKTAVDFSPDAKQVLRSYGWPGNVRELKGVVERGAMVARGERIEQADLPEQILESPSVAFRTGVAERPTLAEVEKNYIELILHSVGGNQTRAAQILGISRKALWEKRRRYGLE